ncbi:13937_t:CDS:1, partial [Dentiscutata heterogama]
KAMALSIIAKWQTPIMMITPATTEQCHQDTTKLILRFDTWKENRKLDM